MSESKVFRVIVSADPVEHGERRKPYCVVYIEANGEALASSAGLQAAQDDWRRFSVAPMPTVGPPISGFTVTSVAQLDPDERSAWELYKMDFEVCDRWRLRRGIDMLEGGEPWWRKMAELRRELSVARELLAKYMPADAE